MFSNLYQNKIANCKSQIANKLCFCLFVAEIAFFDARRFTAQITQVVKLRPAHTTAADDVDMIDNRRVEREDAFDADAERDLANRHGFTRAAVFAGDDDALKNLQALLVAFLDANVNLHGVARLKSRNIIF